MTPATVRAAARWPAPADAAPPGVHAMLAGETSYWRSVLDLAAGRLDSLLTMQNQVSAAFDGPATERTVDTGSLSILLHALATDCRSDVGWIRPGGQRPSMFAPFLGRWLAELSGGVRVRALLDSATDASRAAQLLASHPTNGESGVRSSPDLPQELLLVDDRIALVPQALPGGEPVVTILREPAAIRLARLLFDTAWSTAAPAQRPTPHAEPVESVQAEEPADDSSTDPDSLADDPLKLQILQLLAAGAKDETIARRTGISLRTCRRHVAAILLALNADSRFQAGANAFRLDLISPSPQL
ncbi:MULTISPECIES: helix-turn-helix transcriptional regulator [unclassified Kitasatospora]|uniref:helix-turn-helix transcriptional regulator n=1 Tax=unclassified Kitasatospora TaxID=2633591 RepID=UPI00138F2DE5|nr:MULTISPECIES: helix-turn-helix transcriptional regulator [unclassified Kitasatospora]